MDYKLLADRLALRYASLTPPTKTGGGSYPAITGSTATPPNALPRSPFVVIWPTEGTITIMPGIADGLHTFVVNFYYAKHEGDIPRESAALASWLGVLLPATYGALKLGYTDDTVMKAIPVSWAIGALVYAGVTYDGITITINIWTKETVVLTP